MKENLDFINLMAYDFHGSWEKNTADHHSPLYKRSGETTNLNTDSGISYWINKGMPASKITMGIPLYGRSWTLSSEITTPPAPAQGPGTAGHYTKEAGNMAYYEICRAISKEGWSVVRDPNQKIGPYAVSPTVPKMWVGYDDPDMAVIKTKYILSKGLGGAMLWDISMDDFRGTYGEGRNPVTSAIVRTLP
jgi:chitinase